MKVRNYNTSAGRDEEVLADRLLYPTTAFDHVGGNVLAYRRDLELTVEEFVRQILPEIRRQLNEPQKTTKPKRVATSGPV